MPESPPKKKVNPWLLIAMVVLAIIAVVYLISVFGRPETTENISPLGSHRAASNQDSQEEEALAPSNSEGTNTNTAGRNQTASAPAAATKINPRLDKAVLNDPQVLQLKQFGVYPIEVKPADLGRDNPFLPY